MREYYVGNLVNSTVSGLYLGWQSVGLGYLTHLLLTVLVNWFSVLFADSADLVRRARIVSCDIALSSSGSSDR